MVRLCKDCSTVNHDFHLYCRKCSAALFRRKDCRDVERPWALRSPDR